MSGIKRYASLALAAAAAAWVLISLGGAIAFMEAAKAIPDWPGSFGGMAPPAEPGAFVEYLHRVAAVVTAVLVIALLASGLRLRRTGGWLVALPAVTTALLAVVATLGALVVLSSIPPALAAVDLGSALMVAALTMTAWLVARHAAATPGLQENPRLALRLAWRDGFGRLVLAATVSLYLALASSLSVGVPSPANAFGLPMWSLFDFAGARTSWLHLADLALSGLAGALILAIAVVSWARRRTETATLALSTVAVVLYSGAALTGELAAAGGFPWFLMGLRVVATATLWPVLVAIAVLEGLRGAVSMKAKDAASPPSSTGAGRAKDLVSMTRPVVTLLLLATAYAGMIAAGSGIPSLGRTVLTLGALALAAGGAQALNQYLERDLDSAMERTARRPLPAGRLAPAEGAAWGLGLCLASLFLMADLVGAAAAALTALGIVWYLLVYTVLLKPRSPASVVVGGVAGALMPLVGSVAVSGSPSTTAILISAVVFLWTPPHFWSLAVLRRRDYEAAGVPVLPSVRGEAGARARILGSSVVLVAGTVGVLVYESSRPVFFGVVALLGGFLLYRAWSMWKRGGEKAAARMYRFSSIYLGLLLLALVAHRLV